MVDLKFPRPKRIAFHANTLNYRGTTVAITDYAKYNEELLGNESIIFYNKSLGYEKDVGTDVEVLENLSKRFNVVGYEDGDLARELGKNRAEFAYYIRAGNFEPVVENVPTAVHAVFQFYEPHGTKYAYVSDWLSKKMTNGRTPFVPHIVDLPAPDRDYREVLGIRKDQTVLGRYGGYYTFDLPFVKHAIYRLLDFNLDYVFLFMGTEPFIKHPNVIFLNETHNLQKKSNFINTCDAMLHARARGESFGLSIAEFLSQGKPVLAWEGGVDQNHLELLKNSNLLYNENNITDRIINIKALNDQDWRFRVRDFTPYNVMKKFKKVFL